MFKFFSQLFKSKSKKETRNFSKQDPETAFKLHGLASSLNSAHAGDQLTALKALREHGHITADEFQKASKDLLFNNVEAKK